MYKKIDIKKTRHKTTRFYFSIKYKYMVLKAKFKQASYIKG